MSVEYARPQKHIYMQCIENVLLRRARRWFNRLYWLTKRN